MGWVTDHPPKPVDLETCVTCGLCLPVCPTFRLTGDETASPRGRLTAMNAVDAGLVLVDERFDDVTSFCLQCRACETACPSMVPYGDLITSARAESVAQIAGAVSWRDKIILGRVLSWHWLLTAVTLVAAVMQRLRILRFLPLVGRQTRGLRRIPIPVETARGGAWGSRTAPRVVLFAGCVADVWFAGVHKAAVELLVEAGHRVEVVDGQTCCGALASHSGLAEDAARMANQNIRALAGSDPIAIDVAGCGAHIKGYGRYGERGQVIAENARDITELVAEAIEEGRLPTLPTSGVVVAVQDPCHLEHGQGVTVPPRTILAAAGFEIVDADPGGLCCGAAGVYQLEHPATADMLGEAKATAVVSTGATIVASANAGCEMQLRRFLDAGYEIAHPVELYRNRLRSSEPGAPGLLG